MYFRKGNMKAQKSHAPVPTDCLNRKLYTDHTEAHKALVFDF